MKYTVRFSCGHEGVVELFGKNCERERKLAYFQDCGMCPDCYKKSKQEEAEKESLVVHVSAEADINSEGMPLFTIWISGNTKPVKDEIKQAGFRWGEYIHDVFAQPTYAWQVTVSQESIEDYVARAIAIGAEYSDDNNYMDSVNARIAKDAAEKWHRVHDGITKPKAPEKLKGHKWNNKVYGKKGSFRVYLDGAETFLTDEEAEIIKEYVAAKENYRKALAEAESK